MRDDHLFVLSSEFFVSFTLGQVIEEEIIDFVMTIIILLFIPVIKIVFIPSDKLRAPASKRKRSNTSAPLSCSLPAIARCLNLLLVIIKFLRPSSAMLSTFTFWYVVIGTPVADAAWKSGSRYRGPKPTSET